MITSVSPVEVNSFCGYFKSSLNTDGRVIVGSNVMLCCDLG